MKRPALPPVENRLREAMHCVSEPNCSAAGSSVREVAMMAPPIARLPLRTAHRHCEASGSDHERNAVSPSRTIGPARMTAACVFSAHYLVPGNRLIITKRRDACRVGAFEQIPARGARSDPFL
jgi:hypothetical protein